MSTRHWHRHPGGLTGTLPMFATTCRFAACFALLMPAVWRGSPATAADAQPAFAIRGTLPWHNFLSGPTAWNEADYRAYRMTSRRAG